MTFLPLLLLCPKTRIWPRGQYHEFKTWDLPRFSMPSRHQRPINIFRLPCSPRSFVDINIPISRWTWHTSILRPTIPFWIMLTPKGPPYWPNRAERSSGTSILNEGSHSKLCVPWMESWPCFQIDSEKSMDVRTLEQSSPVSVATQYHQLEHLGQIQSDNSWAQVLVRKLVWILLLVDYDYYDERSMLDWKIIYIGRRLVEAT